MKWKTDCNGKRRMRPSGMWIWCGGNADACLKPGCCQTRFYGRQSLSV
ncbi:hypothetical protein [Neisseria canis]|nr:hypothetical protein [Neisseria canis]